jgi:hypothetical protein
MYVTSDAFWNPEVFPGCRLPGPQRAAGHFHGECSAVRARPARRRSRGCGSLPEQGGGVVRAECAEPRRNVQNFGEALGRNVQNSDAMCRTALRPGHDSVRRILFGSNPPV